MGLALVVIGLLMIIVGGRGTYAQFAQQLSSDFTGNGNFRQSFTVWFLAVGAVGVVGYLPALQTISRYLLALVLLVIFLKNGNGFFSQFKSALQTGPKTPNALPAATGSSSASSATTSSMLSSTIGPSGALTNFLLGQ